jgi:hypothetical protein
MNFELANICFEDVTWQIYIPMVVSMKIIVTPYSLVDTRGALCPRPRRSGSMHSGRKTTGQVQQRPLSSTFRWI